MLSHLSAPNAGAGKTPEHRSRQAQRKTRKRAHCVLCFIAIALKIHELGAKVNFARKIFCPIQSIKPMFERFTEKARRVIFLARYEASQYGSNTIEIEHLLLGALKEDRDLIKRFSGSSTSAENIRTEIEKLEGRKRFLESKSSLSTITVNIQTPVPIVVSASGFGHTVREAASESLELASAIVLFFVRFVIVMIPVFVFLILPVGLLGLYFRRRARRFRLAEQLAVNAATD